MNVFDELIVQYITITLELGVCFGVDHSDLRFFRLIQAIIGLIMPLFIYIVVMVPFLFLPILVDFEFSVWQLGDCYFPQRVNQQLLLL